MSNIMVKCDDQKLMITEAPQIASGGIEENKLIIDFVGSLWDNYTKTAIFYQDPNNVYYALLDDNDTCVVPREATASKGNRYFGVFGVSGGVTRTSEILRYKIVEGAITTDLKPTDPTPDIYAQLLAQYESIMEVVQSWTALTTSDIDAIYAQTYQTETGIKYLNGTKLQYMWGKVKTYIDSIHTELSVDIEGKADAKHKHVAADIVDLSETVPEHTHEIADIQDLQNNLNAKADKSVVVMVTATASGWTDGAQTIVVSGVMADNNIWVGLASSATKEQRTACREAAMTVTAQGTGTITISCDESVPEIDIPVTVVILG